MGKDFYDERFFKKGKPLVVGSYSNFFQIKKSFMMKLFERVIERESQMGKPEPSFSSDLLSGLEGETLTGFNDDIICFIYELLFKEEEYKEVGKAADNIMIINSFSYLEGISIIRQFLLSGLLDENERSVIVSVKFPGTDILYKLRALRGINGKLSIDFTPPFVYIWTYGTSVVLRQTYNV